MEQKRCLRLLCWPIAFPRFNWEELTRFFGKECHAKCLATPGVSKARLDYLRTTLSAQVGEDGANIDKLADGDRQLLLILRALLQMKAIILDETLTSWYRSICRGVFRLLRHYVDTFKH